jgi:hypothetical protein
MLPAAADKQKKSRNSCAIALLVCGLGFLALDQETLLDPGSWILAPALFGPSFASAPKAGYEPFCLLPLGIGTSIIEHVEYQIRDSGC